MARSHSSKPFRPFPAEIPRDHFGHWLSGFTDGEGCFYLGLNNNSCKKNGKVRARSVTPRARFTLRLRCDDLPVLELVRDFWGCGSIYPRLTRSGANQKPSADYSVFDTANLIAVLFPHFERYPLYAKKSRDLAIWKEGVLLVHRVRQIRSRGSRERRGYHRWTAADLEHFQQLSNALKEQRIFQSPAIEIPRAAPSLQRSLFDET